MNFLKKLYKYVRKNGIRGLIRRMQAKPMKRDVLGHYDFITNRDRIDFDENQYNIHKDGKTTLNWIIPEIGKGSGGHLNIFRFISNLEKEGLHNRIYLFHSPTYKNHDDVSELVKFIRLHFPILNENVEIFQDVRFIKFAHATIATSWQTAYFLRNFNNTISKFYFVQDFEPFFYAQGSEYEFARSTYSFGFRGITAGDWLKDVCRNDFGMSADSFSFSYDKEHYFPKEKKDTIERVFFYARPVTPRRDFELGLLALNELTKRRKNVEVVFAGWDISEYEIPFKHRNLGIVQIDELSDLYAQCDMCLVISNTNLSLLPLEVMASNSVAVCSKGANSSWLVNEENSILVDYEPLSIAETLEYYFENRDKLDAIRLKGLQFAQSTDWELEAQKVKRIILEGIKCDEK